MKSRKIIAYVLSLIMILATLTPLNTFAETGTPTITVESVVDAPGVTVDVNVVIENNPGILGATLEFTYDSGLTLTGAVLGEAFSAFTMTKPGKFTSPCKFVWDAQDISDDDIKDGTILTLKYKIDENATSGDEYGINVSYQDGDILDTNLSSVDVTIKNGSVSVVDYLPGDLNGDNKVNTGDIILLRRHIAGGYEQTINESAADVNSDGKSNTGDIILVRRYIAGGYGVELKPSKPQCSHDMEVISYKAPTCTEDGNIAYWHCTVCNKYYSDANGTSNIAINDTVVSQTGHTVVIDAAIEPTYESDGLTEGKHCSVCNEVIVAQEVIPKLEKNEYSITYHIHNNDNYLESIAIENPNPTTYAKEEGLVLQDLMVKGYNFVGWFTAQTGGTQVTEIAAGITGNKTLYAHWEKVVYTVQFESTMVPQASFTYTASQEMTLPNPLLDRYTFVGWSDKNGVIWETIPQGTTQDLILYANWSSNRNRAVAVDKLEDPIICEDSEAGLMLFTYEIGEIQNVPLYEIMRLNCVNGIISTISTTTTSEISTTQAKSIALTISNATTNSSSWTLENNWNKNTEVSQKYLDQTGQTREEAESLAKSESGTYNLTTDNGGSEGTVKNKNGSFSLSGNKAHSDSNTTETGQNFGLSVDAKFSNETSASASIPIEIVELDVGIKNTFEIGAGADYSNYTKNTNTGTDSWSNNIDISRERSKTTTSEKNWNTSEGYSNSKATSTNSTVANAISKLISEEYGYGSSYAEGGSNSNSQALASTDTKSDEYSTTMTYHTAQIQSVSKSISTSGETFGDYRYVMAGTIHVFAVIGYDVADETYFVYTYNVMDDETYEYVDYSFDGKFNDYETSIIPFEIPHFVNDYVNTRIAKTSGLTIDPDTGIIDEYNPDPSNPDTIVIIPSYISVDNDDGTYKSVKVKGIAPGLFKNNTNLKGIKLSNFITSIPNNAFEGCSSLKYVVAPGVTKIGNNAFKGCPSLEEFKIPVDITSVGTNAFEGVSNITAIASNKSVAQAIAASGAENIVLDISSATDMADAEIEVGNITSFELQGKDKEYSGLSVRSNAETTVINGVKFADCTKTPMELGSENITLNRVTANTSGWALVMTADNADVKLNQTVSLSAALGNAVLCKNATFSSLNTGIVGKMVLEGDMLVAGTITGENKLTFTNGEIKYITDDEFENYRTSCTVTFDANGGIVDTSSKSVAFNTVIGELPMATYGDYTFLGWYTDEGVPITAESVITSGITVYAKWNNWDGSSSEPMYDEATKTYTITNGNELAWISDVSNGVITTGINFPTDITFAGYTIELENDIYLNDTTNWENWKTSAPSNVWKNIKLFAGTFNGYYHTIYGGYNIEYSKGLFNDISSTGIVSKVNVNYSYYQNFCLYNEGVIKECNIGESMYDLQSFVECNYGNISYCVNNSNMETSHSYYTGGICGRNDGEISHCINNGNITLIHAGVKPYVGGIVGQFRDGSITYCVNNGNVSATTEKSYVGGIVGFCEPIYDNILEVYYCYNTGNISGVYVGGIVGHAEWSDSQISYVYNRGCCYGESYVGGIAAIVHCSVTQAYNIGSIASEKADYEPAMLFGRISDGPFSYCYTIWNGSTTIYNSIDAPSATLTSVKGFSSNSLMKNLNNLTGFSTSVWATDPNINDGYPYLIALKDTY